MTGGPDVRADDAARWRLNVYVPAFLVVYAGGLALDSATLTPPLWLAAGIALALVLAGWLGARSRLAPALAPGTGLAIVLTLWPVAVAVVSSTQTIAVALAKLSLGPALMVALIGSRVLAVWSEVAFAAFWRRPDRPAATVAGQSVGAALALGAFLTLLFYVGVGHLTVEGNGAIARMILSAFRGATLVHGAIVLLFCIIAAAIFDNMLRLRADRAVLTRLRIGVAPGLPAREIGRFLQAHLGDATSTRGYRLIRDALDRAEDGGARDHLATRSRDLFHEASRRFLRSLLPLLPLLGFLGTVIGLATAIADLPVTGAPGGQGPDISGSLAGLAIKFETTLLGLIASMIASVALNALERRETELAAEVLLTVDALLPAGSDGP